MENKLFEVVFDEEDGNFIDMISLVEVPAIQSNWQFFDDTEKELFKKTKKGVLIGAAMIPNKILRRKDYNVVFTKAQIEKINNFWAKHDFRNNFNINHDENKIVEGAFVSEHWIIESENDKAYDYFSKKELPVGTLMIKVQFENLALFEEVISELNGFSIEIAYGLQEVKTKTLLEIAQQNILSSASDIGVSEDELLLIERKPINVSDLRKKMLKVDKFDEPVDESDVDNPLVRNVSSEDDAETGTYIRYTYDLKPEHRGEDKIVDNSRNFCRAMIEARRIYSLEDIVLMDRNGANPTIRGYSNMSILEDAGGFNCRHTWYEGIYQLASPREIPEEFSGKNIVTVYTNKNSNKVMKITEVFKKLEELSVEEIAIGTNVDATDGKFQIETADNEMFAVEIKNKEIFSLETLLSKEDEIKEDEDEDKMEENEIDETQVDVDEVDNENERVKRLEDAIAAMLDRIQALEEMLAGNVNEEEDEMKEDDKKENYKSVKNLYKSLFSEYDKKYSKNK